MGDYLIYLAIILFSIYVLGKEFIFKNKIEKEIKNLSKELESAKVKLQCHNPIWESYKNIEYGKEKSFQKIQLRKDPVFQKYYSKYIFLKLKYFEMTGITFYQLELFEILDLSVDQKLTDDIY